MAADKEISVEDAGVAVLSEVDGRKTAHKAFLSGLHVSALLRPGFGKCYWL